MLAHRQRGLSSTEKGEVAAEGRSPIQSSAEKLPPGWAHQQAEAWWKVANEAIRLAVKGLGAIGRSSEEIEALAIDSTSGTFVPLDKDGHPLLPALMYNDVRAVQQAESINSSAEEFCARHGYSFNASFALPKMVWIKEHLPRLFHEDRAVADW
jgi:xylulokinase